MLKPEAARKALEPLTSAKTFQARVSRLTKLPKSAAAAGLGLLGHRPDGTYEPDWDKRRPLEAAAAARLDGSPRDRQAVVRALFPTLADDIEAGWGVFARLPYTVGHARRAFRAPNRPAAARARRAGWLDQIVNGLGQLADDTLSAGWLAAWAVHLGPTDALAYLFAGVLDRGGKGADAVFEILKDSGAGRHDIGGPGRHVTRGLLCCARPDAWQFVENLLLAAQRQEGLRQAILEAVDEAHPEAFARMLGLLLDKNLLRFASVARAAAVWLGEEESALEPKKLKADLTQTRELLGDPAARDKAVARGDAHACYRGLWAVAFADAEAAVAAGTPVLADKNPARRFAAARLLAQTGMPEVVTLLLPLLEDPDLRVVREALDFYESVPVYGDEPGTDRRPADLFERLEKIIPRLPAKPQELKPPAPGWPVGTIDRSDAADLLLYCLGDRPAERLLPHLGEMSHYRQRSAVEKLCEPRTLSSQVRDLLVGLLGSGPAYSRGAVIDGLKKCKLAEDEAVALEGYLTRKPADLRRGVFELLLGRPDKPALGSVGRLLASKDANQRAGGVEVARRMADAGRQVTAVRQHLAAYRDTRGAKLPRAEAEAIDVVLNPRAKPATLDDCLGLIDPAERTRPVPPKKRKVKLATPAAVAFLKELDAFIHEHRDRTFVRHYPHHASEEKVLGSLQYGWEFPRPDANKSAADDRDNLPLRGLWEGWLASRPGKTRDIDGLEILRASALDRQGVREGEEGGDDDWDFADNDPDRKKDPAVREAAQSLFPQKPVRLRYAGLIGQVLEWFRKIVPVGGAADFVLDATETSFAAVPASELARVPNENDYRSSDWRDGSVFVRWLALARSYRDARTGGWTADHDARLYRLLRWLDEPGPAVARRRPELREVLAAYKAGAATAADFADELVGPRTARRYSSLDFSSLGVVSRPWKADEDPLAGSAELHAVVGRVRERVLEVELARGESPTAATRPAHSVAAMWGAGTLFRVLRVLGKAGFANSSYSNIDGRAATLTQLARKCRPLPGDTPEVFAELAKAAEAGGDVPQERLLELGLVNPRWVPHVEATVGWPGYAEAVWWLIAHTAEGAGRVLDDAGGEDAWSTIIKTRTNLTPEQRADGVVDVAWFHKAYAAVGKPKRWDAIEAAAKFLGYGQGHKKAARLADVLLGKARKKELVDGIRKRNLKEYVKLLGLLPLPADPAKKEAELHDRYKVLKGYERYARGLSALSKEPAMQASRLGLENLAVTAGYADPMRLEWAVGAREVADLLAGPATVTVKDFAVSLALTPLGEPELTQTRGGKPAKSLPADVRKLPKVAELLDRRTSLKRSAASTRRSLELAMCQGDRISGAELRQLMTHALVRPLVERLVFASDRGRGYPGDGGLALRSHDGSATEVAAGDALAIAHPLDLLAAGDWHLWQAECFRAERLQPFKQVFREVYTLTPQEREEGDRTSRYAGQQLNPTQATALFGGRGWSTRDGIEKVFRGPDLVAEVVLNHGYTTPAEVEGPAVQYARFRRRGDWKPVMLADVPATVFSEVMRDLDLVVSVAHVGGVDPEATASTVEMRAALVGQTCSLLKLGNVSLDGRHALVRGGLGHYSVHLGSGVVHKQPGGSLCVVPVHAQHRGRLFLPFADDDPRTAEVVSKVLLLARDTEIQDPTILEQIAGR